MHEKSEFLGKENIRKLLFKLSTPVIIGMLVQALYNVVDTLFVGWAYGAESVQAIGGLSIAFPVQMIIMAFGIVLGTGGSSIISRALGARETERAERVLGNVFSLSLILSVFIAIPCLLYLDPILKAFGATPGILPYAREYLEIIIAGGIVFVFGVSVQNIVRAEGNARLAMNTMLIGGGLNILLDPIFIFGFGMGVKGAAIATVLSQAVGSAWLLQYFLKGKGAVQFKSETLKPAPEIIKEIGTIGLGSFVMECSSSVMMIFVYNALASYGGDVAIAVFGIVMKINSFIFLPLLGMAFGLQPIVGFNYGAKRFGRIVEAVKLSLVVTTTFGLLGLAYHFSLQRTTSRIFQCRSGISGSWEKCCNDYGSRNAFDRFECGHNNPIPGPGESQTRFPSLLSRQLLFLIPLVILLPRLYGLSGVWAAFPASDFLSFMLSGLLLFRVYGTFKERHRFFKNRPGSEMAVSNRFE